MEEKAVQKFLRRSRWSILKFRGAQIDSEMLSHTRVPFEDRVKEYAIRLVNKLGNMSSGTHKYKSHLDMHDTTSIKENL